MGKSKLVSGIIYIENSGVFFNTKTLEYMKESQVKLVLWEKLWREVSRQGLIDLIKNGEIRKFTAVNNTPEVKSGYYNTFDYSVIEQKWSTPVLHPGIELLISNLCQWDQTWIEWLHKAILYKYTHILDVELPCVVFYWKWGTWKSTFIELLKSIFGEIHVMGNLRQSELVSNFDCIEGDKLIYEFAEVTAFNNSKDKLLLNKMKNYIFAKTIMVRKLYQQAYKTSNSAWYIITSNSMKPIMLDSEGSWNRRFSCFRSTNALSSVESELVYSAINSSKAIQEYIAWLFATYPDIETQKGLPCLENRDKQLVVDNSEDAIEAFIRYLREHYAGTRLPVHSLNNIVWIFSDIYWTNAQALLTLFKGLSPFHKSKGLVDGRNVWYYEID